MRWLMPAALAGAWATAGAPMGKTDGAPTGVGTIGGRPDDSGRLGAPVDSRVGFEARQFLGRAPLMVTFDASRTAIDPAGSLGRPGFGAGDPASRRGPAGLRYTWSFGDGTFGAGRVAAHTYTQPGQYDVHLIVWSGRGVHASETFTVTASSGAGIPSGPVSANEARRFLWQAAFGPRAGDVNAVAAGGFAPWIDAQVAMAPTFMTAAQLTQSIALGYGYGPESLWDDFAIEAPDQLRQRMAWALGQILVMNNPQDTSSADTVYWGELTKRALGNYRDLLGYVTRSHQMGVFLTYINNLLADPQTGSVPDENFARELMQLFTVGLWMLNPDGTLKLGPDGAAIPTFDNATVGQFARVFTGYRWGQDFAQPMPMIPSRHEFGSKQLLNYPGVVPPGGFVAPIVSPGQQTEAAAQADVDLALDNVFNHPNCAPFVAQQLIQRLVTSNPTPAYVRRVAEAFEGFGPYGSGVRGDLAATARAILLDEEARDPAYRTNPFYGLTKEPTVIRWGLHRAMERIDRPAEVFPFRINTDSYQTQLDFGQSFMGSPSVFNFYLPHYVAPLTTMAPFGMFAPELQIYNDFTAMASQNRIHDELVVRGGTGEPGRYNAWRALSGSPAALVDALNDELMHGAMSAESRAIVLGAVTAVTGSTDRVRTAVWLVVNSPEFRALR